MTQLIGPQFGAILFSMSKLCAWLAIVVCVACGDNKAQPLVDARPIDGAIDASPLSSCGLSCCGPGECTTANPICVVTTSPGGAATAACGSAAPPANSASDVLCGSAGGACPSSQTCTMMAIGFESQYHVCICE